jgi:hypothetical protein
VHSIPLVVCSILPTHVSKGELVEVSSIPPTMCSSAPRHMTVLYLILWGDFGIANIQTGKFLFHIDFYIFELTFQYPLFHFNPILQQKVMTKILRHMLGLLKVYFKRKIMAFLVFSLKT